MIRLIFNLLIFSMIIFSCKKENLETNQNIKYKLEVVSLKDSKTAEPVIVDLNIIKK